MNAVSKEIQRMNILSILRAYSSTSATKEVSVPDFVRNIARLSNMRENRKSQPETAQIIPIMNKYLSGSTVSMRNLSQLAWSLDRLRVNDEPCWSRLVDLSLSPGLDSPSDLAVFVFSLANSVVREPLLVSPTQSKALLSKLNVLSLSPKWIDKVLFCDCVQLCYGVSVLFPRSSVLECLLRKSEIFLSNFPKKEDDMPQLDSCREVCLLWSTARNIGAACTLLPSLLEASRGLRFCPDFNQNKVAQLCESVHKLGITDARVIHQIIHFVDVNYASINSRNLLRIIENMSNIDNDILWRRISNRLEQPVGLAFSIEQLETIKSVYKHRGNRRTWGILELYQKTKIDAKKFGPS